MAETQHIEAAGAQHDALEPGAEPAHTPGYLHLKQEIKRIEDTLRLEIKQMESVLRQEIKLASAVERKLELEQTGNVLRQEIKQEMAGIRTLTLIWATLTLAAVAIGMWLAVAMR